MIAEGLKLTLLGMSMVFIFLVLLVGAIYVATSVLSSYTLREEERLAEEARKASMIGKRTGTDDSSLLAVISAAVHAFRNSK